MSKNRVNIMLSDEALSLADASGNRSQHIEDLIIGRGRYSQGEREILDILQKKTPIIETPYSSGPPPEKNNNPEVFVPRPPDPTTGYDCCEKQTPCKHWVWDMNKTGYTNSLTGAFKEPEL